MLDDAWKFTLTATKHKELDFGPLTAKVKLQFSSVRFSSYCAVGMRAFDVACFLQWTREELN